MRYYKLILNTTSDEITKGATIRLRDYDFESAIGAVNRYMYQNLDNNILFLMYREENGKILTALSYDEKRGTLNDAYDCILKILSEKFSITKIGSEPYEITMAEFIDCIREAKRRGISINWSRLAENAKIDFLIDLDKPASLHHDLKEQIISNEHKKVGAMYDEKVIKELENIESHKNTSNFQGNMVHYIISAKSNEAAIDIAELLAQRLAEANRLSGRRMDIISQIEPDIYCKSNFLDSIIENNYGGVIIIDLSEKFGCDPVSYGMTCEYIEKLVKRYKNDCLFIFTYNPDKPGFAFQFLQSICKCIIPIELKEGSGNRKAAVNYLKELIKNSKYSEYAQQANEFMKQFPGDTFTQTDVLTAFEQFEPWCLNKNIFNAYDSKFIETFMLDRDEGTDSSYDKLNKMIGLTSVKEQIDRIIKADIVEKERKRRLGGSYEAGAMHMIFAGNPGTAKTTVAKLFGGIAKEKGILKSGALVETSGLKLDGMVCSISIKNAFKAAEGGVLFIDEAYSMTSDYAITILLQELENQRDKVIVILAGYSDKMKEFIERNEGLKSRIPHWIDFPDYTTDELTEIFKLMLNDRNFNATEDAIVAARNILERARCMDNFGNGRYVRNLLDNAVENQSVRIAKAGKDIKKIRKNELFTIIKDDISMPDEDINNVKEEGDAKRKLSEMIGLTSVKETIDKIIAGFRLRKMSMEMGIKSDNPALHMVFTGNPGTAKTTVARLFAEIMRDEKILPSGNFVEVGRADIVGKYVGHTGPLVKKKFKDAQGGVLFIDEAYSLCDGNEGSFGDEAINTIVQEMENHRDDVIVIFAGYPEPMRRFIERNPGMQSRIAFNVEFEDYTVDELCEITKFMASNNHMTITDAAMEKLRGIYSIARKNKGFGNGRFARKMLEQAEMNLAQRVSGSDKSLLTIELITTIEECDISAPPATKQPQKRAIGF